MESDPQIDSSLQRSIDELDQEFENSSNESESENQSEHSNNQQNNDDKKQDKQKYHLKQKKSAYNQLLPPDQDVQSIPPFIVVVHGSKSSGKSSLIRSLVKHFTKHKINDIKGTITMRSTKKQRITIIQCPNDIRAMIDLSKIADIVLLLFDASLGLEMETFEFLSLLKCHGFPHVMGVLNHLDYYKDNKQLKKTKKKFKKRFQYQVGGNNKLFYLSKHENGVYSKIETAKIARYIGTSNPPSILWRQNHPFVLADRWQLAEDRNYRPDDEVNCQFYGYIRGSSYRMNGRMHFVGMGDYFVKEVQVVYDPCPQYKKDDQKQQEQEQVQGIKSSEDDDQSLNEQQEIQAKKKQMKSAEITQKRKKRRTLNQNERIIYAPNCNLGTLHFQHTSGYVTIPHQYVKFTRRQKGDDESSQSQIQEGVRMIRQLQDLKETIGEKLKKDEQKFELFEGMEMQDSESEQKNQDNNLQFAKKKKQLRKMKQKTQNMLIANPDDNNQNNRQEDLDYLIYQSKQKMITHDCSKFHPQPQPIDYDDFKGLFMTGMQGDILNQMNEQEQQSKKQQKAAVLKKPVKKAKINEQNNFFQKGFYVRVTLQKMKYKDYLQISNKMPVILSRINLGEDNLGFVKVNFKRHRWYSNLLKSNDPIIVSSGWRRYQTLITFAKQDPNDRMRYLKYTPGHQFCTAVFYGNFTQQNSGCVFTQTIKQDLKKFRIAGSGMVMQINKSFEIMKKIKLIGEPYKVMKNTAFIKGMFNSNIQVSKYIGAQIRTVSGIRGQIKKTIRQGGEGCFRATFEDKILMSDIVFCKAWYRIYLERFYNPVLNFGKNRLMKTKYQLRIAKGVQPQQKPDSQYKNVDRAPQVFAPFVVPKKLQANLPFKTRQKVKMSKKQKIQKRQNASMPKILMSDKQRHISSLIQRLNTIKNEKNTVKQSKLKQKQRIKSAMERPKQEYYQKLKKQQKSEKMAALMRKKKSTQKRNMRKEQ